MSDFYLRYPYKEGYVRIIDGEDCYYIPKEKIKELLLEEFKSVAINH
jgi:hypothetical protein